MRIACPRLYLGTMTFGWKSQTSSYVDESIAQEMTRHFIAHRKKHNEPNYHIDTARIYSGGKSESIVGSIISKLNNDDDDRKLIILGTKAHPSQPLGLSPTGIRDQLQASLSAANTPRVDEFYLHQPDTERSLLESLRCAHEIVSEGLASCIGMSNYHYLEMERAFHLCESHGLTKPSVYQGLYNPLNRMVEEDLIPLLKRNDCAFVAYNPLAAGMLAGKHDKGDEKVKKGRFRNNPNYLPRFYTDENFQAVNLLKDACDKEGISLLTATYGWLLRHSALDEKDGVLLGASSIKQLQENLEACGKALGEEVVLSEELLTAFEEAWKVTKEGAFPYWRGYSEDMPDRDNLDQGASYSANKTK